MKVKDIKRMIENLEDETEVDIILDSIYYYCDFEIVISDYQDIK